jgi:hypothetical protein
MSESSLAQGSSWRLEVEIQPGDSLRDAADKVALAYEAQGCPLLELEQWNNFHVTASYCRFFQVHRDGREYIIVVASLPWDEKSTLAVLEILLGMRLDPDPPGLPPLFRFHGAHPTPPVFVTMFGDTPVSDFECRAALVARFGTDLQPSESLQLATVAMQLLRECLGVRTSLSDPDGELRIAEAVSRWLPRNRFPEGGAPFNAILTLGFLYGEILRARFPYMSRWVRVKDYAPFPVLVFGPKPSESSPASQPPSGGLPQVVFNPTAFVIELFQNGPPDLLRNAATALEKKCKESLGDFDEN